VIKFFNNESVDAPLVEHATMTLAALAGISVAATQVVRLSGLHAVAIRRFDRKVGGGRIHSVSAGTAIRAASAAGQEQQLGYPELARLLRRAGVATDGAHLQDARELFRRMVFNILMDNTDDHEKNHSLLVVAPFQHGRLRLAPAYDLLPTHSGQGYQEFICGKQGRESTLDNAMSECDAFGLMPAEAAAEVVRVVAVVNTWKLHFAQVGVSPRDIESLAQQIDGDFLLRQRTGFEPERFVLPLRKSPRKSPFRAE
jgi:serine/threonine-protein kinase HipA